MRPRSLGIMAIRIFALVIGIEAVTAIISLITFGGFGAGAIWATLIARLIIAFALWGFAEHIVRLMVRGTDDETLAGARRSANIAALAFSVVGVVLVTQSLTDFVATLWTESAFGPIAPLRLRFTGPGFFSGRGGAVLIEVVQFAIGLGLIVFSGVLARYVSQKFPESEPPSGE